MATQLQLDHRHFNMSPASETAVLASNIRPHPSQLDHLFSNTLGSLSSMQHLIDASLRGLQDCWSVSSSLAQTNLELIGTYDLERQSRLESEVVRARTERELVEASEESFALQCQLNDARTKLQDHHSREPTEVSDITKDELLGKVAALEEEKLAQQNEHQSALFNAANKIIALERKNHELRIEVGRKRLEYGSTVPEFEPENNVVAKKRGHEEISDPSPSEDSRQKRVRL